MRGLQHPGQLIIIQLTQPVPLGQIEQGGQHRVRSQPIPPGPPGERRSRGWGAFVRVPVIRIRAAIPAREFTVSQVPVHRIPVRRIPAIRAAVRNLGPRGPPPSGSQPSRSQAGGEAPGPV